MRVSQAMLAFSKMPQTPHTLPGNKKKSQINRIFSCTFRVIISHDAKTGLCVHFGREHDFTKQFHLYIVLSHKAQRNPLHTSGVLSLFLSHSQKNKKKDLDVTERPCLGRFGLHCALREREKERTWPKPPVPLL